MLGEKIGEHKGKITGRRVINVEGDRPVLEMSVQVSGKLLGTDYDGTITYQAEGRNGGWMSGYGEGVLVMKDGEIVTFTGNGTGKRTGKGTGMSWRGCIFYETSSNKHQRLNGLACVFEHEVDDQGNVDDKVWEWK